MTARSSRACRERLTTMTFYYLCLRDVMAALAVVLRAARRE
jgi:hypothetical protein